MAGRYDRVNGAWEKVRKRYAKINGAWTPVKKRYDKVNGVWSPSYSGSYVHLGETGLYAIPSGQENGFFSSTIYLQNGILHVGVNVLQNNCMCPQAYAKLIVELPDEMVNGFSGVSVCGKPSSIYYLGSSIKLVMGNSGGGDGIFGLSAWDGSTNRRLGDVCILALDSNAYFNYGTRYFSNIDYPVSCSPVPSNRTIIIDLEACIYGSTGMNLKAGDFIYVELPTNALYINGIPLEF